MIGRTGVCCAVFGFSGAVILAAAVACTGDIKVEEESPAKAGATQPEPSGDEALSLDDACERIESALRAARDDLGCDGTMPACPGLLRVAGALPCTLINASTVDECVDQIGGYGQCSEFDEKPCIVTVDPESCETPERRSDGGDTADASRLDGATDARDAMPSAEASTGSDSAPGDSSSADSADSAALETGPPDGALETDASDGSMPDGTPLDAGAD